MQQVIHGKDNSHVTETDALHLQVMAQLSEY